MNKGLLAGALVQGLGNLASQTIQTRAASESEQTKFRRDVALETLKQSGTIQAKQAERLPLPLDNPAVQEHLALSIGTTVPQVQGLLDSMRVGPQPGQDFTPEQQKQMGELYKQISAALAGLDPKQAEAQKHRADAEGKTLETQMTSDYLTNPGARPVISGYYGDRYGHREEPFTVSGGAVVDKRDGKYQVLPQPRRDGKDGQIDRNRLIRDGWQIKQREVAAIRQQLSDFLPKEEKAALLGKLRQLEEEAKVFEKAYSNGLLSPLEGNAEGFIKP
ncbi:hypothetical protein [Vogesella indigofera]|uniref:hypothetical protein n=1 Tax=Vogesella indigofera TaxID=45465 RepID=UPI00234C9ABF|nr:hypothetical protein [Vogesella indigofera]MDC7704048.1 hypothetical protein [Vogesella indigofera]